MKLRFAIGFVALSLGLVGFMGGSLAAKTYNIKLSRASVVGSKYRVEGKGSYTQGMNIKMGPRTLRSKNDIYDVQYQALVTVKAIDAQKQSSVEEHKIEKFVKIQGKTTSTLLAPGTVVTVSRGPNGKAQFHVGKTPVNPVVGKLLQDYSDTHEPNQPTDDAMFGTSKPQKVGASWGINKALMAKSLQKSKTMILAKDLQGQATLEGVAKKMGKDCLKIRATLNVKRFEVPLPGGLKMHNSNMTIELFGHFPVNPNDKRVHGTKSMTMSFFASGKTNPRAPAVSMRINMKFFVELTRTYLK